MPSSAGKSSTLPIQNPNTARNNSTSDGTGGGGFGEWYDRNKTVFWSVIFIITMLFCVITPIVINGTRGSQKRVVQKDQKKNAGPGDEIITPLPDGLDDDEDGDVARSLNNADGTAKTNTSTTSNKKQTVAEKTKIENAEKVKWEDVIGQENAKQALKECAIWPRLRKELFRGPRSPARGILLYGPPGTGKTMLAKAVASNLEAAFYSITSADITNYYFGQSEKIVRSIFNEAATQKNGAVIFIDEVDSILASRGPQEHEGNRKIKTQILMSMQGVQSNSEESNVLVIGATNRPFDLDEAALRRFEKRIRVDLPDARGIAAIIKGNLEKLGPEMHHLTDEDFLELGKAAKTKGYNASDVLNVVRDASMEPIRNLDKDRIPTIPLNDSALIVEKEHFLKALGKTKNSVDDTNFDQLADWEQKHAAI